MKINNKNISTFNARLIKYKVTPAEVTNRSYWEDNIYSPTLLRGYFKYCNLEIDLLISGSTAAAVEESKGKLNLEMLQPKIILDEVNVDITYSCIFSNQPVVKKINEQNSIVTYNFRCIKEGIQETINLNKVTTNQNITVKGDVVTDAIIELTPDTAVIEFTIGSIKIKNLEANKKIIIDGINKKVTVEGANKFKDVELWEFPKFKAGTNTIKMSSDKVAALIKYKPRYI